jgi:tetratricopeptide (TPR) repeat protein
METYSNKDLNTIRSLLKEGKRHQAVIALEKLISTYPTSGEIWWLLANAYDDRKKIQRALSRTLRYQPENEEARRWFRQMLKENDQNILQPTLRSSRQLKIPILVVVSIILVIMVFIMQSRGYSPVVTIVKTSTIVLPTATIQSNSPSPTATEFASPTPIELVTAVAVVPTDTVSANSDGALSFTQTVVFEESGTPSLRFHEFPVLIYMDNQTTLWLDALQNAMSQINPIIPLTLVSSPPANNFIYISILDIDEYRQLTGCPNLSEAMGCARLVAIRNLNDNAAYSYNYVGNIWLQATVQNPEGSLLHELFHALGVQDHSQNSTDIMYPYVTSVAQLSANDIRQLRILYMTP